MECTSRQLLRMCSHRKSSGQALVFAPVAAVRAFDCAIVVRMLEVLIKCGACNLRPLRPGDAASLQKNANNPKIAAHMRDRFPSPYSLEDAASFISMVARRGEDAPEFVLGIEVYGSIVGTIGIIRGTDIERLTAELGYWIGEDYWGQGVMTSAVQIFVPWVMAKFGLVRLFAGVFSDNLASCRVLEKAGLTKESVRRRAVIKHGEIKDIDVYVMLR